MPYSPPSDFAARKWVPPPQLTAAAASPCSADSQRRTGGVPWSASATSSHLRRLQRTTRPTTGWSCRFVNHCMKSSMLSGGAVQRGPHVRPSTPAEYTQKSGHCHRSVQRHSMRSHQHVTERRRTRRRLTGGTSQWPTCGFRARPQGLQHRHHRDDFRAVIMPGASQPTPRRAQRHFAWEGRCSLTRRSPRRGERRPSSSSRTKRQAVSA